MPLNVGTLGPYAVTAKIGEGGMGEVYRARDTKLDRDVALKVLPQAFTLSAGRGAGRMQGLGTTSLTEGVQMRRRVLVFVSAMAVLVAFVLSGVALATAQTTVPRTTWGQPDLQGIWDFRTITPLQRPEDLAEREFLTEEEAADLEQRAVDRDIRLWNREGRPTVAGENVGGYNNFWMDRGHRSVGTRRTSLIVDPPNGRLPDLSPVGQRRTDARLKYLDERPYDSYTDLNAFDRCIAGFNAGPPITPLTYNNNMQLFQTPDHVVVYTEMVHTPRVVPLDGHPALTDNIRLWSGDSRGYWEGDTLVVETANFSEQRQWIPYRFPRGVVSTANMTLVERFTRVDADTLEYTFTVSDPETWTSPWTASMPMRRTDSPLFEYACHEGNYSMAGSLAGQRAVDKAAAEAATQGPR